MQLMVLFISWVWLLKKYYSHPIPPQQRGRLASMLTMRLRTEYIWLLTLLGTRTLKSCAALLVTKVDVE